MSLHVQSKCSLVVDNGLFTLHNQSHSLWHDDAMDQGINSHDIDLVLS